MKSKFIYLFISVFLLFTGCASNKVSINYENSNPIKIEESTQGLEISDFLPPAIEKEISNNTNDAVFLKLKGTILKLNKWL